MTETYAPGRALGMGLELADLRQTLTSRISLALLLAGFLTTWLAPADDRFLRGRFAVFLSLLLEGILAYAWRQRHPRLTQGILLLGPTLSLAGALRIMESPFVPFYAIPLVLAMFAINPKLGLTATILNSASLLLLRPLDPTLANALLLLWMVAGIELIATRALYTAIDWASNSEQRAVSLLSQLRSRQGELNRTLAALTEASRRLERTNRELDTALQEAEEARDVKRRFVANISHELRTPLNIIVGFAEMLCTSPETYGDFHWPPALRQDLLSIRRSGDHLLKMVDDVLDLAQIEASRLPVVPEPTDLTQLIQDTLSTASTLLQNASLELRVSLPAPLPVLNLDRTRIRQVLLNLVANAVRHTSSGYVEVGTRLSNGEVVVYVRDSGEGIPADKLETIFQEFEQADASLRRPHEGTGLGLAISKHFIRLHGGRMWAESETGKGSTFCFSLPTANEQTRAADLRRIPRKALTGAENSHTVVALCQDPVAARMLERHLEGVAVLLAGTISEAAALVSEQHPGAVLVSGDAPGRLGTALECARALRSAVAPLDLPIMACNIPTERHAGLALGADEFLIKPVTRRDLSAAIGRICSEPHRVLIVDDQPDILRLLSRMVKQEWPEAAVRALGSGKEAIDALGWLPDVILLDLLMPEVTGMDVIQALRARPDAGGVRVVAITARGPAEELAAIEGGEVHVVRNGGFTAGELMRLVELLTKGLPPRYADVREGRQHIPATGPA